MTDWTTKAKRSERTVKNKLQMILWILMIIGIFGVSGRFETIEAQATETQEYVTVRYYLDSVAETNCIGEQKVAYRGIAEVEDVSQLQLDADTIQAYHKQGQAAERYRSGKVVSYDKATLTASVVYTKVAYTVNFYKNQVTETSLGSLKMSGLVGDVVNNRFLGRETRNMYKPETGYLSGQIYQTITLSDTDAIEVKVVYHPIVEQSKIYFYNVCGTSDMGSDAILIESNGHFGLVDCGEDKDYPDGTDPKYPLREDIVTKQYADEQDLINFISGKGVTELDFIILTHAHSDHMGAADEIIAAFDVEKVYAREYDDKYITEATRLWDNQYVYDKMVAAATKYGVELIQNFDEENTSFAFEDLRIQIKNYETDYEDDGETRQSKWDDNENSLGVLVTDSYDHTVFLAGDIDNIDGDEDKLALDPELASVTVLKIGHHGYTGSNTVDYLNALNPQYTVVTNSRYMMDEQVYQRLVDLGTQIYYVMSCKEGITLDVPKIEFTREEEYSGWEYDSGLDKTYYYVEGAKIRDCVKEIDGKTCRFRKDGSIYNAEFYQDPTTRAWYYYAKGGAQVKSDWVLYKNEYYYMDAQGKMVAKQWITSKGKKYYLKADGAMLRSGWHTVDGKLYYFNDSGALATSGWLKLDGDWYYLKADNTRMESSWLTYKGDEYYLDADGKMLTSVWKQKDGGLVYLQADGTLYKKAGWFLLNKKYYYLKSDGSRMQSAWISDNGKWYYVDDKGVMESAKWDLINGKWYYFQTSGAIVQDGWKQIHNCWYYFYGSGAMYENEWVLHNGKWYFMGSDGAMITSGWAYTGGKWYYFDGSGIMLESKWGKVNGTWYYFGKSGAMYENQWLSYKGDWYYLNRDGAMVTSGWVTSGGNWYYLKADGVMAANTTIDGKYRVNKQGVWVR